MTKTKRNIVITVIVLAAIALLIGIGSNRYRNWNFRSWLNYWGAGVPAATALQSADSDTTETTRHSDIDDSEHVELEE